MADEENLIDAVGMTAEQKYKLNASLDLLYRTGAKQIQIRFSDDVEPTIWFVVASYDGKNAGRTKGFEVDAAANPLKAATRLCERLVDGAICAHCGKPTGLEPTLLVDMPFPEHICWYQYDPELKTFRRGCE